LRALDALGDEQMVNMLRSNPPHAVIEHTHAPVMLALTGHPDAESAVRELFGRQDDRRPLQHARL